MYQDQNTSGSDIVKQLTSTENKTSIGDVNTTSSLSGSDIVKQLQKTPENKSSIGQFTSDVGRDILSSTASSNIGLTEIGRKIGMVDDQSAAQATQKYSQLAQDISNKRSEQYKKESEIPFTFKDEQGFDRINKDVTLTTAISGLAQSAPQMVASMAAGGVVGKVGGKVLSPILDKLGVSNIISNYNGALTSVAKQVFPKLEPNQAVSKFLANQISMTGGASLSEGLITASQNAGQKRQDALNTDFEILRKSPAFQQELNSLDPNLPQDVKENKAREIIANKVADQVFSDTFKSTAGIGLATGGGAIGDVLRASGGKITSGLIKTIAKDTGSEALQEAGQSGMEQYAQNKAIKDLVNPDQKLSEGVLEAATSGAALGGLSGGGLGVASHLLSKKEDLTDVVRNNIPVQDGPQILPTTGEQIVNSDVANVYKKASDFFSSNVSDIAVNNPDYEAGLNSIKEQLNSILNPEEGKEVDPIKKREAEEVLKIVDNVHSLNTQKSDILNKQDEVQKQAEDVNQSITETDDGSIRDTDETTKDSNTVTSSLDTTGINGQLEKTLYIDPNETQNIPDFQDKVAKGKVKLNAEKQIDEALERVDVTNPSEVLVVPTPASLQETTKSSDFQEKRQQENDKFRKAIEKLRANNGFKDAAIEQYRQAALQDPKTGLKSYVAFTKDAPKMTKVSVDADGLKWVNDNLGHIKGDELLAKIGEVMKKHGGEDAYHVSGDEFILQFPSVPKAKQVMKLIEDELQTHSISDGKYNVSGIGISYGISSKLESADKKMYAHKEQRLKDGKRFDSRTMKGLPPNVSELQALTQKETVQVQPIPENISKDIKDQIDSIDSKLNVIKQAGKVDFNNSTIVQNLLDRKNKLLENVKPEVKIETPIQEVKPEVVSTSSQLQDNTSATKQEIEKDKLLDQKQELLDKVDSLEVDLQEEVDEDVIRDLKNQIATLKRQARDIDLEITGKEKIITKEQSTFKDTEYEVDGDNYGELQFDSGNNTFPFNTPSQKSFAYGQQITDRIFNNLSDNIKEDLEMVYVDNMSTQSWDKYGLNPSAAFLGAKGIHTVNKRNGKSLIIINGQKHYSGEDVTGTIAHELIGHYGIRRMLGGRADDFFLQMLNNNDGGKLKSDILSLVPRWPSYLDDWNSKNDINALPQDQKIVFKITTKSGESKVYNIPIDIAIRMADEYFAELARAKFNDATFMKQQVGLGIKTSPARTVLRAQRDRWYTQFIKKIRHLLRKVFGTSLETVTDDDLTKMVARSTDMLFETVHPDYALISPKPFNPIKEVGVERLNTKDFNLDDASFMLDEEDVVNRFESPISNLPRFIELAKSDYGELDKTVNNKVWDRLDSYISSSPLLSSLKVLGNLPDVKAYQAIENVYKGKLAEVEKAVEKITDNLKSFTPIQNSAAYTYFTTRDADVNLVPATAPQKNLLKGVKDSIENLGQAMVDLGMLSQEAYDNQKGMYLRTVYLKYLDDYRGSGKRTSILSYLKQKKDKTEEERLALGQIKDIRFLIPETLGIMARDHVLLSMFSTINQASSIDRVYWVLDLNKPLIFRNQKYTIQQADEIIKQNRFVIDYHTNKDPAIFQAKPEFLDQLIQDTNELEQHANTLRDDILSEAFEYARNNNQTTATTKTEFLNKHYKLLDNKKTLGELGGKYIRNEIANDLDVFTSSYDLSDKNIVEKIVGRGGYLERFNRFNKTVLVGFNAPSWGRNTIGNLSLLDLSTSTPTTKLVGNLYSEVFSAFEGKPSEWWQRAENKGLFGTTYGSVELMEMQRIFSNEMLDAKKEFDATRRTNLDDSLWFTDPRVIGLMRIGKLYQNTNFKLSKGFAFLEGAFKTVAMRDYVERWESQNKEQYPQGLEDLDNDQQEVLLAKAAQHANDAIFDYSQVHSVIKSIRSLPVGAPFITFTYKAVPASLKAMINHPIKFAKYATLPALITMISSMVNNWDDDDLKEFNTALPEYYRRNTGIAYLPTKDERGNPQIVPLDYVIPWSQWTNMASHISQNFKNEPGSPVTNTINSVFTGAHDLGFLGSPIVNTAASIITGKDPFTGKDVVDNGTSPDQQLRDRMLYTYDTFAPKWISSTGWFNKLYHTLVGDIPRNSFGDLKYQGYNLATATAALVGFEPKSVNLKTGKQSNILDFNRRVQEVNKSRAQYLKTEAILDDNLERTTRLKSFALREKMIRTQQKEFFAK